MKFWTAAILPCLCLYKYLGCPDGSCGFLWKGLSQTLLPKSRDGTQSVVLMWARAVAEMDLGLPAHLQDTLRVRDRHPRSAWSGVRTGVAERDNTAAKWRAEKLSSFILIDPSSLSLPS